MTRVSPTFGVPTASDHTVTVEWGINGDTPKQIRIYTDPFNLSHSTTSDDDVIPESNTWSGLPTGTLMSFSVSCLYQDPAQELSASFLARTTGPTSAPPTPPTGPPIPPTPPAPPSPVTGLTGTVFDFSTVRLDWVPAPGTAKIDVLVDGPLGEALLTGALPGTTRSLIDDHEVLYGAYPGARFRYIVRSYNLVWDMVSASVEVVMPVPPNALSPGERSLIQGTWGSAGNFELLVPQGRRLVHYARINDPGADQFRWIYVREISFAGGAQSPGQLQPGATPGSVSLLQSTFRGDGTHGNLEAVVRVTPDGTGAGDTLQFMWLNSATNTWSAPAPITIDSQPITGVTGDPIMIQANWGWIGEFRVVGPAGSPARALRPDQRSRCRPVPVDLRAGDLLRRRGPKPRAAPPRCDTGIGVAAAEHLPRRRDARQPRGRCPGHPRRDGTGDTLQFIWLNSATNPWTAPAPITIDSQPITGVTGDPIMIQANWGWIGNFELLVPQGRRLVHYARINDPGADQFRWIYVREISFAGGDQSPGQLHPGATPGSVSLLQSTFRGDGDHGNLEAVVRVTPDGTGTGDTLQFMWLNSATNTWSAPAPITIDGQPITGVTG